MVSNDPDLCPGTLAALSPNSREFENICSSRNIDHRSPGAETMLSKSMGGSIIVHKGAVDLVATRDAILPINESLVGSIKRCGGQGDLLAGSLGIFLYWSKTPNSIPKPQGAINACILIRRLSGLCFGKYGRSLLTSDILNHFHEAPEMKMWS